MKSATRLLNRFSAYYRLPLRSLSLMRIAVATVVLIDLFTRWADMEAFYTDAGTWPVELIGYGWKEGYWSFHAINGSLQWQTILFVLHVVAAMFLLSGWHTVRATFVTWLLLVSLHNRNVFVLQSGDDLLRLTLFLGIFLPWHSCYSIDAANGRKGLPPTVFSYLAYLLLIASVYLFSVLHKSSAEWRSEGTAIYYALSLEQMRLPYSGDIIYRLPQLMKLLTWLVMALELIIPLLILLPSKSGRTRKWAFLCIVVLHIGITATLYVGLFPVIAVSTAIGLLPLHASAIRRTANAGPFAQRRYRTAISVSISGVALVCLLLNMQGLSWFSYELRRELRRPIYALRLDQYWGMFSPSILKNDGWFVYQGVDDDGHEWDLRKNAPHVDYKKPERLLSVYKNDRWRKFSENMKNDNHTFLRPLYADYLLRKWNRDHPDRHMAYLHFYHIEKVNLPGYKFKILDKNLYCVADSK